MVVDLDVESRGLNGLVIWVVYIRVGFGIKINIFLCYLRWDNKYMRVDCLFYFLKISFCFGIYYDNIWDDRNIYLYLFKFLLYFKLNL